jgi:hypothetical protein
MDVSKLLIFQAKKMKQAQILVKIRFKGDLILIPFQYFSEDNLKDIKKSLYD